MRVRSTDRVSVAVHSFGGAGRPLLLSHATGFHAYCYLPMADLLTDRFECWALDYRGHGDTPRPTGPDGRITESVDWDGYGDDALAAARAVAPDGGLVGFGHSMGGAALLMAALRESELFDRLVVFEPIVFDPAPGRTEGGSALSEGARRRRATFPSFEAAIDNYASKPPFQFFDPDVTRLYVGHGFRASGEGVRLKCDPEHEAQTFEGSLSHDTWNRLGEIHTPTLVVAGQDGDGPALFAPQVAERLGNARFVEMEGGNHFSPFIDLAGTARLVLDAAGETPNG